MKQCLVTGGAGFIGSHLVEGLLAHGHAVRVIDNLLTGKRENLAEMADRIDFVEGDIRSTDAVDRAMAGCQWVFHEAALPSVARSVEDPWLCNDVNVGGTVSVLEACRRHQVERVIYAGSSSAYGDTEVLPKDESMAARPLSPYAAAKLAGEYYVSVYASVFGLSGVTLRYFNVFGPRQDPASQYAAVVPKFITAILAGERPTVFGDGEQSRDFTYVDNVVRANLLAAEAPDLRGQVINVACGTRTSLNGMLTTLGDIFNQDVEAVHADERPGDVKHSQADITLAERLLGYSVEVSFDEGLRLTIDWCKASKA